MSNGIMPITASVSDIQKRYRELFDKVKKTGEPLVILKKNKPEVAIVDILLFEEMSRKVRELEEKKALEAVAVYEKEKRAGKLKKLKSVRELFSDEN